MLEDELYFDGKNFSDDEIKKVMSIVFNDAKTIYGDPYAPILSNQYYNSDPTQSYFISGLFMLRLTACMKYSGPNNVYLDDGITSKLEIAIPNPNEIEFEWKFAGNGLANDCHEISFFNVEDT